MAFALVPTPFKSATNSGPGQGYLEAEFDTVNFLPQDLVSAVVLREWSQSLDEQSIDSTMESFSKGGFRETLEYVCILLPAPSCG